MKSVFVGALFLASAFAQQGSVTSEQNYISSISTFKKGLKIPDHLKGKSLLNSAKWASLQNPPEVKIDHQEAAVTAKPVKPAEVKPTKVKPVEVKTPKAE